MGNQVSARVPVETVQVLEPGAIFLKPNLVKKTEAAGKTVIHLSTAPEGTHIKVSYRTDTGASVPYLTVAAGANAYRDDAFTPLRRNSPASPRILAHALDLADEFVSRERSHDDTRLACASLLPGRLVATDGVKALIVTSKGLPRVRACISSKDARPLISFLGAAKGSGITVGAGSGRIRIEALATNAVCVAPCPDQQGVDITPPTGAPGFSIEAQTFEFARTLAVLRACQAGVVHVAIRDHENPVVFSFATKDRNGSGESPVQGAMSAGSADSVPAFNLPALEGVLDGLKADRATLEFRRVRDRVLLISSAESVTFGGRGKKPSKKAEAMTITRCVLVATVR